VTQISAKHFENLKQWK